MQLLSDDLKEFLPFNFSYDSTTEQFRISEKFADLLQLNTSGSIDLDDFIQKLHPDDQVLFNKNLRVLLEEPDNDIHIVDCNYSAICLDENESLSGFLFFIAKENGFSLDGIFTIGESRKESEFKDLEIQRAKALINAFPDSVFTFNLNGELTNLRLTDCSNQSFKKDPKIGDKYAEIFNEDVVAKFDSFCHRFFEITGVETFTFSEKVNGKDSHFEGRLIKVQNNGAIFIVKDITHEFIQNKRIESLARFPNENPNPVLRVSTKGILKFLNIAAYTYFSDWNLELNEAVPEELQKIVSTVQEKKIYHTELKVGNKYFSTTGSLIVDDKYINLYFTDITDLKNSQLELYRSNTILTNIFDSSSGLICRVNLEGIITFVNKAYASFLDKTPEEIIGQPVVNTIELGDFDSVQQTVNLCIKSPGEHFPILLHKTVNNRLLYTKWEFSAIRNSEGTIEEIQTVGVNVTEIFEANAKLTESEEQFRKIAENSSDGIMVVKNGYVSYISPSFTTNFGYSYSEFMNTSQNELFLMIHKDDVKSVIQKFNNIIAKKGKFIVCTYRFRSKSGEFKWREDHVTFSYDKHGELQEFTSICRDIHERKIYEEQLIEKNKILENITFMQAHLLRHPVTNIQSLVELIKMDDLSIDQKMHFFDLIEKESKKLDQLIHEIVQKSSDYN